MLQNLIGFVDDEASEVEDGRLGLTSGGLAIATATMRGRTPKEKAAKVVDAVLRRAQSLLGDEQAPTQAEKIWLFGSYIDPDRKDVGDIDIVVESHHTGVVSHKEAYDYVTRHYPGLLPEDADFYRRLRARDDFLDRSLFGKRRHPLLAPNDIGTLKDLHRPCALVFDRLRGGLIDVEFFDHHPESTARAEHIRERLALPDMAGGSERFRLTPPIVFDRNFVPHRKKTAFGHMEIEEFEGGDRFKISSYRSLVMSIARNVALGGRNWDYEFAAELLDEGMQVEMSRFGWLELAETLVSVAQADVVRLASHRHVQGTMQTIYAQIVLPGIDEDHPLQAAVNETISSFFEDAGGRSLLPRSHEYGIDIECGGNGFSLLPPHEYDDEEWELASTLPFSREEYFAWAALAPGEEDWRRLVEFDETSEGEPAWLQPR